MSSPVLISAHPAQTQSELTAIGNENDGNDDYYIRIAYEDDVRRIHGGKFLLTAFHKLYKPLIQLGLKPSIPMESSTFPKLERLLRLYPSLKIWDSWATPHTAMARTIETPRAYHHQMPIQ